MKINVLIGIIIFIIITIIILLIYKNKKSNKNDSQDKFEILLEPKDFVQGGFSPTTGTDLDNSGYIKINKEFKSHETKQLKITLDNKYKVKTPIFENNKYIKTTDGIIMSKVKFKLEFSFVYPSQIDIKEGSEILKTIKFELI